MSFFSPSRTLQQAQKAEPVFKTPMSFSPRRQGDKARPSPSRVELWKEELGLEDDVDSAGSEGISNSDDETEVDQNTNKKATCSLVEYEALQKELEERSAQRDELLYRIKTLNDKNKMYKSRLEREEVNKKQQLKIMRRTHEAHLEEKTRLVTNLEALLDEQEAKVFTLEAKLRGEVVEESDRETSSVSKLVAQIDQLQTEKVTLVTQVEQSQAEVERLRATTAGESENYEERLEGLERENSKLQEEVIALRNIKSTGSTDAEKQVCRLEIENDRLQRQVRDAQQTLARIQSQTDGQSASDNKIIKKLKEDNDVLTRRLQEVEAELGEKSAEYEESERRLRSQLREVDSDQQNNARQVRDLSAQLTALQAKSPEVITKVRRVEVESQDTQELLDITRKDNARLSDEIESLKEQLAQNKSKLQEQHSQLLEEKSKILEDKNKLQEEKSRLEEELSVTRSSASSTSSSAQEESSKFREEIERLRKELGDSSSSLRAECDEQVGLLQGVRQEKVALEGHVKALEDKCKEMESHVEAAEKKTDEVLHQMTKQEEETAIVQDQLHEEISRFQAEVQAVKESKVAALDKVRRESAERQHHLESRLATLEEQLGVVGPVMRALVADYRALREKCLALPGFIKKEVEATTRKLVKAIADIAKHNEELVRKYRKEMALRKKYHNELVELKGNIRVFARVRPRIKEDGGGPQAEVVVDIDPEDDGIVNVMYKGRQQTFEVDKAFPPEVAQPEVFNEVQALVTSCIDGYNVCIFAYGQTGSGKTYTMEGTLNDPGINQRALRQLFMETAERSGEWKYTMTVSVLEIYNEMIRDLLSTDPNQKLDVKMAPEGGVHVPGLTSYEVSCVDDVNQVFAVGRKNRQTASTNMNEHSSRSHALLSVRVVGTNITTGAKAKGKLNLVDLAGSERVSKSGADGDRLKEAQSINKSLSCLGDVIHALRSRQSHVPYRNSKLTYLLQDSLGGDSKTLMIVQVSPVDKNCGETNASLSFAARVRSVELGMATRKVENADGTPNGDASNGLLNGRGLSKSLNQSSASKLPMTRRK